MDFKGFVTARIEQLKQIRDAPHAVAGGVAIGVFWGFTPLVGLKTLLSLLLAWALRCSKFSAVIAVTFHDILIPVWPVILRWEYELGYWVLSHPHRFPAKLHIGHFHASNWMHMKTLALLWPVSVGAVIIGLPLAALSYVLLLRSLQRYEKVRHCHLKSPA